MVASPGDGTDVAREGYYPDPSIPGYVRYWNGATWVPGTSRPAPATGDAMPTGRGGGAAAPAPAPVRRPTVEETGPVFFDEEPEGAHLHGSAPEPASAWQADTSRQTGFGGERDRRVSWGSPPRDPRTAGDSDSGSGRIPRSGEGSPAARDPRPAGAGAGQAAPGAGSQAGPTADPSRGALPGVRSPGQSQGQAQGPGQVHGQGQQGQGAGQGRADSGPAVPADSTMAIRALRAGATGAAVAAESSRTARADGTMAIRTMTPGARNPQVPAQAQPQQPQAQQPQHQQPQHQQPQQSQPQQQAPQPQPQPAPAAPAPVSSASGGGAASWAQQVHRLAQPEHGGVQAHQQQERQDPQQPVVPWKPPVSDPFLRAAQAQAAARPAGLGRRLAARLVDTVVLGAVVGAVGVPLVSKALTHIDDKVEAAKLSGETVTVWLIDGTTAGYLGIVLGAFLLFGVVYEAFPTSKWGRTLGKKLFRLHVRDIEEHEPPAFGAALRRWLLYGVLGVLVIGIVNVAWCLFDRPWRQCWHDKAARTFVAGNS
ncbi:RDD family protein [Streptomyces sp. H27-C3]|uniref:RDD family protein n=1 Tax=Streptomyces sp. H27-C3 TaxID=3046305 RepID=UPI0024B96210|nr:RDD family protein [Streptomyces sp. H27-C3]MDJ0461139.1 RDD family protein [Streptomyces sp. H27-C3]